MPKKKGTETLLVVDNDQGILELIKLALSPLGYRLLFAKSGVEALKRAEEQGEKIDLLLTDMMMPGMTGLELAETFMREFPKIKILIMSGYMCPSIAHQDVALSEKAFVKKPFTAKTLISKLRSVLRSDYIPEIDSEDKKGRANWPG